MHRIGMNRVANVALALVLIATVGCSSKPKDQPNLAPVSGRVTFKGKPVEGATVAFHGAKSPRAASGRTDGDGRYKLTMFNTNDGAVLGENVVTIMKVNSATQQTTAISIDTGGDAYTKAMNSAAAGAKSDSELPEKYGSKDQSGLSRTVAEGNNEFNFDLE